MAAAIRRLEEENVRQTRINAVLVKALQSKLDLSPETNTLLKGKHEYIVNGKNQIEWYFPCFSKS